MKQERTYISKGDFTDLYYKVRQKGPGFILKKLRLSGKDRIVSKWNAERSTSDFWIIPEIHKRWREKCTGNPDLEYEDYFIEKYLADRTGLRMLSAGCGAGSRERKFARYPVFELIEGIDIAGNLVSEARKTATDEKLDNINYHTGDFVSYPFEPGIYDVILFNSSLHHFKDVNSLLRDKVKPLLKAGGYLVIFEYTGPDRLQWTKEQLDYANALLRELPVKYKRRYQSRTTKQKIYRPGWLRMLLVDPSEAVDSESILPSLHRHFETVEEKKLGWDILHLLLKDIAHNFLEDDPGTKNLLSYLFKKEDEYLSMTGRSDAVFGVYRRGGRR